MACESCSSFLLLTARVQSMMHPENLLLPQVQETALTWRRGWATIALQSWSTSSVSISISSLTIGGPEARVIIQAE